jgi:hypothetical protein
VLIGGIMGLRPNQCSEKRLSFSNYSPWKRRPTLCHLDRSAAQWRDLRFSGPFVEMCFSTGAFALRANHEWVAQVSLYCAPGCLGSSSPVLIYCCEASRAGR